MLTAEPPDASFAAALALLLELVGDESVAELWGRCRDSEYETFRTRYLRDLRHEGLSGVRLVISHAHAGLGASIRKCFAGRRTRSTNTSSRAGLQSPSQQRTKRAGWRGP